MTNERLQELKHYVQRIRNNGWISLAKSNDLLTLIDSAMTPVSEAAQRAIDEIIGTNYGECQIHRETLIMAVKALKQYKGE